jgi:putative ABC transport system permease protein
MTVSRGVLVFMLTVAMCAVAGGVAMHKLKAADPAEIF